MGGTNLNPFSMGSIKRVCRVIFLERLQASEATNPGLLSRLQDAYQKQRKAGKLAGGTEIVMP